MICCIEKRPCLGKGEKMPKIKTHKGAVKRGYKPKKKKSGKIKKKYIPKALRNNEETEEKI